MRATRPLALIIAAGLAASLTGCFGNPVESIVEGVIKEQTGIDVNTSTDGTSASLPADWPGLPVPEGQITSALSVSGTFVITVLVDDEAAIESVISQLLGQGYTEESRADLGGLKSVLLRGSEWTTTVGWLPDEETGKFIVNYGVVAVEK